MYSFHFEIRLNEFGRPIIVPLNDKSNLDVNSLEAKFMAAEITRAVYQNIVDKMNDTADSGMTDDQIKNVEAAYIHLNKFTSVMAYTIKSKLCDQSSNTDFDVQVVTESDRDNLNYNGIIYDGRIFFRKEGLRVRILDDGSIFELKNGVDNQHWVKIK